MQNFPSGVKYTKPPVIFKLVIFIFDFYVFKLFNKLINMFFFMLQLVHSFSLDNNKNDGMRKKLLKQIFKFEIK